MLLHRRQRAQVVALAFRNWPIMGVPIFDWDLWANELLFLITRELDTFLVCIVKPVHFLTPLKTNCGHREMWRPHRET